MSALTCGSIIDLRHTRTPKDQRIVDVRVPPGMPHPTPATWEAAEATCRRLSTVGIQPFHVDYTKHMPEGGISVHYVQDGNTYEHVHLNGGLVFGIHR